MTKRNLFTRLLTLPLIACIMLIHCVLMYFKIMKQWFLYGGEIVRYEGKDEYKNLNDMYLLFKDNLNK